MAVSVAGRRAAVAISWFLASSGRAQAAADAIDLGGSEHAVIVEMLPGGAATNLHESRMFAIAKTVLEARAGLLVRSAEQDGVDLRELESCRRAIARIRCWTRATRRDLRGPATAGRDEPAHPSYLIILRFEASSGRGSSLTGLTIDTKAALRIGESAPSGSPEAEERLENQIFENATTTKTSTIAGNDDHALELLFIDWLEGPFRAVLERNGDWGTPGTIELTGGRPGLAIRLDGRVVGQTRPERTLITGAPAGSHELEVEAPESKGRLFLSSIEVRAGETIRVVVPGVESSGTMPGTIRRVIFWTGVGLTALGAGVSAYGAVRSASQGVYQLCQRDSCRQTASTSRFTTLPELDFEPGYVAVDSRSGAPVVPLGYSLALVGVSWALAAAFLGEADDPPWVFVGLGMAAGAASLGISAALN
ncbi:MAG: hypothetical protein HYV07_08940 [Deltaproteobacteria bacterium]|nr:hypothetical protein [Deltaproteobacteria bacterium]